MLPDSRLYTFMDEPSGFTLSFLEGQKLIHDLAMIHDLKGKGFAYFRDSVLTSQPLIQYLKPGEGLGLFIDSEIPYFRLKLETNFNGYMRTLLLPETFSEFPSHITGKARLSKVMASNPGQPYTSIIELANIGFHDVVNKVIKDSYQMDAEVFISEESDQSVLLSRLPDRSVDKAYREDRPNLKEYWMKIQSVVKNDVFAKGLTDQAEIEKAFEKIGMKLLMGKDVTFKCSCSRERMVMGIKGLCQSQGIDHIFEGKPDLETKCDYCKTAYLITADEIK